MDKKERDAWMYLRYLSLLEEIVAMLEDFIKQLRKLWARHLLRNAWIVRAQRARRRRIVGHAEIKRVVVWWCEVYRRVCKRFPYFTYDNLVHIICLEHEFYHSESSVQRVTWKTIRAYAGKEMAGEVW